MGWIQNIRGSTKEEYLPILNHLVTFFSQHGNVGTVTTARELCFLYSVESEGKWKIESNRATIFINQSRDNGELYKHMLKYNNSHLTEPLVCFLEMLVKVERGVDIKVKPYAKNPVQVAIRYCTGKVPEAVEVLLKRDCNYHVPNEYRLYPLHYACGFAGGLRTWQVTRERLQSLEVMLKMKGVNVNVQDCNQITPMHCAVLAATYSGAAFAKKAIELLITHGGKVTNKDSCGLQPLHYCCGVYFQRKKKQISGNYQEIIELLVRSGASVNEPSVSEGMTPLHYAVANTAEDTQVLETLLSLRVDVNAQDREGMTPLHYACNGKTWPVKRTPTEVVKVLKILISQPGIAVNIEDHSSKTALHYAVSSGVPKLVDLICQAGVDSGVFDIDGKRAIDLVKENSKEARIIKEHQKRIAAAGLHPSDYGGGATEEVKQFFRACRLVAMKIGNAWRMFFRHLEPRDDPQETEALIRELEEKYRGQLQEPAYQALLQWRNSRGLLANINAMATALRDCHLVAIAEEVERLMSPQCQSAA